MQKYIGIGEGLACSAGPSHYHMIYAIVRAHVHTCTSYVTRAAPPRRQAIIRGPNKTCPGRSSVVLVWLSEF